MNKADLKKKWFKYCDTDKLTDDVCNLLKKYGYTHTENGVCALLDAYFQNKEPLIKLFIKSKNYIGNMRIVTEKEFERQIDSREIYNFFDTFHNAIHSEKLLVDKDNDNHCLADYLITNKNIVNINNLTESDEQKQRLAKMRAFNYVTQNTLESQTKYQYFATYMQHFANIYTAKIMNDFSVDVENKNLPVLKKGTKTSRAFNAVCTHFGVDKLNPSVTTVTRNGKTTKKTVYPYDRVFAVYSDLVSDLVRKMRFVISLNPLDYLTMSFGVSWNSCHSISGGAYKGGCLSYMLDGTSMITFVISNNDDSPIHEIPKLYRQMYHYEDNLFIQSRLYPQGNDGATDLYAKFRGFVVEEFSDILKVDGAWRVENENYTCMNHIHSEGVHYKDYNYRDDCSIFYPVAHSEDVKRKVMTIGHEGICVNCGKPYSQSRRLNHQYRSECEGGIF